ncbi:MAG: tyrosine-protein phosphatase [Chloroflexota bacterium]
MAAEGTRARRLAWEGCPNARDLGGYPTADGRQTRWGSVFRADCPSRLTDAGRAELVASGVRTIVDLRLPAELVTNPNPFASPGVSGIAFWHESFIDPTFTTTPSEKITLAGDYQRMLQRFSHRVAAIVRRIADAPEGPVLFHCWAGKDRTGLISALLLELAGVPREIVAADYALSEEYGRARAREWLEKGPGGTRAERAAELAWGRPTSEVMHETLADLDERHGGAEGYLRQAGVSADEIGRLRERVVEAWR